MQIYPFHFRCGDLTVHLWSGLGAVVFNLGVFPSPIHRPLWLDLSLNRSIGWSWTTFSAMPSNPRSAIPSRPAGTPNPCDLFKQVRPRFPMLLQSTHVPGSHQSLPSASTQECLADPNTWVAERHAHPRPPDSTNRPRYLFDPKPPLALRPLRQPQLSTQLDLARERGCPVAEALRKLVRGWLLIGGSGRFRMHEGSQFSD